MDPSAELDKVLTSLEIPGVEQSDPKEDTEVIRFTIQLRTVDAEQDFNNPSDPAPEVFIFFTRDEFQQANATQGGLERKFDDKIKQGNSDADSHSKIRKERDGVWRALAVDGQTWEFDLTSGVWTIVRGVIV